MLDLFFTQSSLPRTVKASLDDQPHIMRSHVLLVEDDMDLAAQLAAGLENRGFNCTVSHYGRCGLDQARKLKPAVVVLDLMLPDLDGMAICDALRREPVTAAIPIVLMARLSGSSGLPSIADRYISKPFRLDEIESTLRDLISQRPHVPALACPLA
jgi:two-component system phosphate regulon response regulator PhoB